MIIWHYRDRTTAMGGLCNSALTSDSFTGDPAFVTCIVCKAKLVDRKKESIMKTEPMHYIVRQSWTLNGHVNYCDMKVTTRGSTDPGQTTCEACKQTAEWQAEAESRGIPMPKDALQEAAELRDLANTMLARAADIERTEKAKALPEEPPMGAGQTFKLIVWFRGGRHTYTYLLVRKPGPKGGPWYTTGTGETGFFENWAALVEWLRSDNITGHSALIRMEEGTPNLGLPNKGKVRYTLGGKQR